MKIHMHNDHSPIGPIGCRKIRSLDSLAWKKCYSRKNGFTDNSSNSLRSINFAKIQTLRIGVSENCLPCWVCHWCHYRQGLFMGKHGVFYQGNWNSQSPHRESPKMANLWIRKPPNERYTNIGSHAGLVRNPLSYKHRMESGQME